MISPEYAAGFFDGEGNVHMGRTGHGKCLSVRATVANTDANIIRAFHVTFGGSVHSVRKRADVRWKPAYQWRANGRLARRFLETIAPHVIVKRTQVELALAFFRFRETPRGSRCELQSAPAPGIPWRKVLVRTPETIERENRYIETMHDLNRKGLLN